MSSYSLKNHLWTLYLQESEVRGWVGTWKSPRGDTGEWVFIFQQMERNKNIS